MLPAPVYEGRIRPSYIAAAGVRCLRGLPGLRGANSPLLHCGRWPPGIIPARSAYEGRIRPSYIAAFWAVVRPSGCSPYEGRIRPSYIAALRRRGFAMRRPGYEGRIRPSYIAARKCFDRCARRVRLRGANSPLLHCGDGEAKAKMDDEALRGANSPLLHCGHISGGNQVPGSVLRGANSPLLHCGRLLSLDDLHGRLGYEGRIRPSYIAAVRRAASPIRHRRATRGEFAPPTLRLFDSVAAGVLLCATRGEFAPPTLRRSRPASGRLPPTGYEGRIRPSYIAARSSEERGVCCAELRGANSPLLHCGMKIPG